MNVIDAVNASGWDAIEAELRTLSTGDTVKAIYDRLGSDLTDYHRESVI